MPNADQILIGLSSIIVLGVAAQWLAWRLRLPVIVLLLTLGFIMGPVTGFLKPGQLFGDLLMPLVSVAVAIILFEGGLNLKLVELREVGSAVLMLTTLWALVTWVIATLAALYFTGVNAAMAVLLGAILVVSGPTVIMPLLKHVRPVPRVASVLKWEAIIIDPIGAILAVLVFEAVFARKEASTAIPGLLHAGLIGLGFGFGGAAVMIVLLKYYLIPDYLRNAVSLAVVLTSLTVSNVLHADSGLLSVTVMGIVMANQKVVAIRHMEDFNETLRDLFISCLFIVLAARLRVSDLRSISPGAVAMLGALILVARPLAVALCTIGSNLSRTEKMYIACIAPRGIVAAAVSSAFALRIGDGLNGATGRLVPLTFMVIVGTVLFSGLLALPLARKLKVAQRSRQGVLICGAHSWARAIALVLVDMGFDVLLADTNPGNAADARADGLPSYHGSAVSEEIWEQAEISGLGKLMALTRNDEVNSLAALRWAQSFGSAEVYQIATKPHVEEEGTPIPKHLHGRFLFRDDITWAFMDDQFRRGATLKAVTIDDDGYEKAEGRLSGAVPLFVATRDRALKVVTAEGKPSPKPGHTVVVLVPANAAV